MIIFTTELKSKADAIVARYETKRASILEILRLVQEHDGHISIEAEKEVAEYLGIPAIDVREVMSFYTLFYDKPKAKNRYHVCRTLPCWLRGGREMLGYLEEKLGVKAGQFPAAADNGVDTVECLGACEIAPMMMVNDEKYVGPLTKEKIEKLLERADSG